MKAAKVTFRNNILVLQFIGDVVVAFVGLSLGFFLRFYSPLKSVGNSPGESPEFYSYLPLIAIGAVLLIFSYANLGVYNWKLLLRPGRLNARVFKGTSFWFLLFLFISLALKFEPSISRIFVATSWVTVLVCVCSWKLFFHRLLYWTHLNEKLVQRVALVGWSDDAQRLAHTIYSDQKHPYEVAGVVLKNDAEFPGVDKLDNIYPKLGALPQLEEILSRGDIDILVVCDLSLRPRQMAFVAGMCERKYIDLKITPTMFQIFVSGLQLETISGQPILGIEELAVRRIFNSTLKRGMDICGALVGLVGSFPIMLILAYLIKKEDGGPIFYRQTRTGLHGKPFTIYKIRSMRIDAEQMGGAQWAKENDPRRLKVGAFMRENNLDELPQFWNVLKGDMSLVGPRPERPELIAKFEKEINHYNPRHEVKPGITGWAQVNGLRGDTSLVDRIRYDIFYIENWNILWDFQIMIMTFIRRDNAY